MTTTPAIAVRYTLERIAFDADLALADLGDLADVPAEAATIAAVIARDMGRLLALLTSAAPPIPEKRRFVRPRAVTTTQEAPLDPGT